jgi:hypothetical protein
VSVAIGAVCTSLLGRAQAEVPPAVAGGYGGVAQVPARALKALGQARPLSAEHGPGCVPYVGRSQLRRTISTTMMPANPISAPSPSCQSSSEQWPSGGGLSGVSGGHGRTSVPGRNTHTSDDAGTEP